MFLYTVVVLYLGTIIMLNIPYFQRRMAAWVEQGLADYLQTELHIGGVDIGLLNRIIVNDLDLKDRSGRPLLSVSRFSLSFDWRSLLQGRIDLRTAQLYGFRIRLDQPSPDRPLNAQFLIDAFGSKQKKKEPSHIDLRINSILMRHGSVSYDLLSSAPTPGRFNPDHVRLDRLMATVSLKHLTPDSLHLIVKRFGFDEQSGFSLSRLKFDLKANRRRAVLNGLEFRLPSSRLSFSPISADYSLAEDTSLRHKSLRYQLSLLPSSHLSLADLSAFSPFLSTFSQPLYLSFSLRGTSDGFSLSDLDVHAASSARVSEHDLALSGACALSRLSSEADRRVDLDLHHFRLSSGGIRYVSDCLSAAGVALPAWISGLGDLSARLSARGTARSWKADASVQSAAGELTVASEGTVPATGTKHAAADVCRIRTDLQGKDLDLAVFLKDAPVGKTSFDLHSEADLAGKDLLRVRSEGQIAALNFKDYLYQDLHFEGQYDQKDGWNGNILLDDPNLSLSLQALYAPLSKGGDYELRAHVSHLNPFNLHLLGEAYRDAEFSFSVDGDVRAADFRDFTGYLHLDSLRIRRPGQECFESYLHLEAQDIQHNRRLVWLRSPYMEADLQGRFDYATISSSLLRMMSPYIPSLFGADSDFSTASSNNFDFFVRFRDTQSLTELLDLPLTFYDQSYLSGSIADSTGTVRLKGSFPQLRYSGQRFSNLSLLCSGSPDRMDASFAGGAYMKNGTLLDFGLGAKAQNDRVDVSFHWDNHADVAYYGDLALTALLRKQAERKRLSAEMYLHPAEIVLGDSLWQVEGATVRIDSVVRIQDFHLHHADRFIAASGVVSASEEDSLCLDLRNVPLGYVFDILNFHPVDFDGSATGHARALSLLSKPRIDADLDVRGFMFNGALMGDMDIRGGFHGSDDVVPIDARIRTGNSSVTTVLGEVRPKRKSLDLQIEADSCNVGFVQPYIEGILSRFGGLADGSFHLGGTFKGLELSGEGLVDASFRADILGADFHVRDSLHIVPDCFTLRHARIFDREGHPGRVDAHLRHSHFKDFRYDLQLQAEGMMVLDKPETFDLPFYGKVYGTGSASLTGGGDRLDLTAALSTAGATELVYKMTDAAIASDNGFVHYTHLPDTLSHPNTGQAAAGSPVFGSLPTTIDTLLSVSPLYRDIEKKREESPMDVRLNLLIDVSPQSVMKVIVDPRAGDYISCHGTGNIRLDFFNKGDLRMFGKYTVTQGVYKFSLQEVIRKDFIIRAGSSVSFGGDPDLALCDLKAVYTVNSVSLRDLGTDVVNVIQPSQNNVRVNCVMDISGMLSEPDIALGIELPNENEEVQRVVRNFISTDDQMNMQILYLLGIGKFYTPDYADKTGRNSNAMSSVLSSTISGQLNDMLSQVINSNDWNFGVNGTTGEEGWTDMEFQGMLSGQLLDNRLLINGNFGYRDNSLSNGQQSNFIGDFDIEYLLTKTGDIRLRAYNKSNDRYSTKTTLNTQGLGVLFRKDFDSWWKWLPKRKKEKKKETKK